MKSPSAEASRRYTTVELRYLLLLTVFWFTLTAAKAGPATDAGQRPRVHHILLEVSDLKTSIAFYRDTMGLELKSERGDFATLEAANLGVYLWSKRWDWESPRRADERLGLGMYPHFEVLDVAAVIERARKAGYKIVQEPREYEWGTEAFVADPDGYTWALIKLP